MGFLFFLIHDVLIVARKKKKIITAFEPQLLTITLQHLQNVVPFTINDLIFSEL
jgi:hypothetical protein